MNTVFVKGAQAILNQCSTLLSLVIERRTELEETEEPTEEESEELEALDDLSDWLDGTMANYPLD